MGSGKPVGGELAGESGFIAMIEQVVPSNGGHCKRDSTGRENAGCQIAWAVVVDQNSRRLLAWNSG